ncbi:hypothetical protein ACNF49_40735 [Actinomadura sp. ATCC 39365]
MSTLSALNRSKICEPIVEMRQMMRKLSSVALVVMLLFGCSAQGQKERNLPAAAEPSRPLPSVKRSPFKERPLTDLKIRAKGKVLLFHVNEKAERTDWTAQVALGTAFRVAVDCVGPEGTLVIQAPHALHLNRQCIAGYTTYTVDDYPPKPPKTYKLRVQAPRGAKWAILITQLH